MLNDLQQCDQCESIKDKSLFSKTSEFICLACESGENQAQDSSPFMELELSKVYPNPDQPRKEFEPMDIMDLGSNIKRDGLLQPIVVIQTDKGYMIVSGERRFRAHIYIEAPTIKAHIIQADEHKVLELSLIENIQREDLTDFEVAKHIGKLWASGNYTKKQDLAQAIGKSQSYISKAFSCLKLDSEILTDLEEAKHDVPLSVLQELSRVKDKAIQKEVYDKYLAKEITRDDIASFRDSNKSKTNPIEEIKESYPKDADLNFKDLREKFEVLDRKLLYLNYCSAEEAKERCRDSGNFMKLDWWDDDMHYHYDINRGVYISGGGESDKDLKFLQDGTFVFFELNKPHKKSNKKKVVNVDTWTRAQFTEYFMKWNSNYIEDGKTYKITIEEL